MITHRVPISMSEAEDYLGKKSEFGKEMEIFIQKFTKLNSKKAKELSEKLEKLEILKIKKEDITKIVDLLPETKEDLSKIETSSTLNEDETKKILDTISEFR